jgi:hypothetical protein
MTARDLRGQVRLPPYDKGAKGFEAVDGHETGRISKVRSGAISRGKNEPRTKVVRRV